MLRNVTQIGKIGPSHPATPPAACHSAEIQINSLIPKTKLASSVQFYSQPNLAPHAQTRTILHKNAEFRKTNDANPNRPLAPSPARPLTPATHPNQPLRRASPCHRVSVSPDPHTPAFQCHSLYIHLFILQTVHTCELHSARPKPYTVNKCAKPQFSS